MGNESLGNSKVNSTGTQPASQAKLHNSGLNADSHTLRISALRGFSF